MKDILPDMTMCLGLNRLALVKQLDQTVLPTRTTQLFHYCQTVCQI